MLLCRDFWRWQRQTLVARIAYRETSRFCRLNPISLLRSFLSTDRRARNRSPAARTKGIVLTRIRALAVLILAIGVAGVSTAAAQACDKTWVGGAGNWNEAGRWSPSGEPDSSQSACITAAGTYTVSITTDAVAKTLTVGGASGVQTLHVVGASQSHAGDTYDETTLGAETMSFAANTKLILEATGDGSAEPKGGGGVVQAYTVTEAGQIETASSDPERDDRIRVSNLQIEPGAGLLDASGTLLFLKEGEGAYPWATTNEGTFTVAPGAVVEMEPSFAGKAGFINAGSVVNEGSITTHGAEWEQLAGSESGNPVALQSSSTLIDSAGTGSFLDNYGTLVLTGTIPAGQTVIVRGEPFSTGGEAYYTTGLSNGGKELVNDGTLVLNPTGSGETGGNVNVEPGSIHNNGVIDVETETASRITQLQESLTNGPSGHLEINGGIFQGNSGAPLTNEGLLTIAPGAVYQLQEGASFVNHGTISPEIAGATSFGAVQLFSPCCNGPGVFTAGGTLAPVLVGGFTPATGQEFDVFKLEGGKFEGTFPSVANGFDGDYAHESSEPAFVGVVYGGLPSTGPGPGAPKGTPAPTLAHLVSISSSHGKIVAKLACSAGGAACATDTLKASVVEHLKHGRITAVTASKKKAATTKTVVIADGSIAFAAGATKTLTLTLNASGRALLAKYGKLTVLVTISSGGKTLQTLTVRVVKPPKPKKK
jgi:hypothetical protein